MRDMTSARVAALSLNRPRTAEVRVSVPGLRTPAHRHAEVLGLDHHERAAGLEHVDDRVGDLGREPFLHLRALGEAVDEARELRQAGDATVVAGDVRDVRAAVERREVVLAHRVQRDVAHQHHLVVIRLERDDEMARRILVQSAEDLARTSPRRDAACAARPSRSGSSPIANRISRTALSTRSMSTPAGTTPSRHVNRCSIAPVYSAMNGRLR